MRARSSSMVTSCSPYASIMRVTAVLALFSAVSKRLRSRVTGSVVRAEASRLSISARISCGSASMPVMWSHTTVSR